MIILTLGDAVMSKATAIVEDDVKSANELWGVLLQLYTTINHQAIHNLINRLNSLVFNENTEIWGKLLSTFMSLIDELGSSNQQITDEENNTKLLRTLPESFKPISRACSFTQISFNDFVD